MPRTRTPRGKEAPIDEVDPPHLKKIAPVLDLVAGLPSQLQFPFLRAVRMYHQGILHVERFPETAYLNLVSAIEVLCNIEKSSNRRTLRDRKAAHLVSQVTQSGLRQELLEHLRVREATSIRTLFLRFMGRHLDRGFWKGPGRPRPGSTYRLQQLRLRKRLSNIYEVRSGYLHHGERFPPQAFKYPPFAADMDGSLGMQTDGREWKLKDCIPLLAFFEKAVQYALHSYLRKNSTAA